MFNLQEYLNQLVVNQDDQELKQALEIVELTELICDDAWLARQDHFGSAGAMERQLEYLGGTLLPNAEARIARMASTGVMNESYVQDSWFGTTNSESSHTADEVGVDQQIDNQQSFVEQLKVRMRTAAILFVTRVRAHDEISNILEQLSYSGIKSKAAANRRAVEGTKVKKKVA
jgi:hypothetical protein